MIFSLENYQDNKSFGNYHYKYASGHDGDAPILGFSPRKTAFSLYVYSDIEKSNVMLESLGKFKMGKTCNYNT
ncbi:DUF1801 domain-containing protein [Aequorivita sp. KMM 9714]|uniref:DUF1801 domain-containing protein n=1 Tax=Aequorivita sp. KMM 9714 TaxID=2707173 RepID=UPI001F526F17|nr:DUF1801 domain-containing protein [Aequorivita sp. KMM 9714]